MMGLYCIFIPGEPIPQPRHRISNRGAYVPSDHPIHDWKNLVKVMFMQHKDEAWPLGKGVSVRMAMEFIMTRPKSLPKKVKYHVRKPDIDNLVKGVMDSIEGTVFAADSQVNGLIVMKEYGVRPGVRIEVEWGEKE